MKISIISFTQTGFLLSQRIAACFEKEECRIYTRCEACKEEKNYYIEDCLSDWTKKQFEEQNAVIFIGACGIAVRAIAPCIKDKLKDSPVIVVDEKMQYVIPILSGHVGGANDLAVYLADRMGACPVITTATDVQKRFAVDNFAKKNDLTIMNREGIAKVSAKVLEGKKITLSVAGEHLAKESPVPEEIRLVSYPPSEPVDVVISADPVKYDALLYLSPREYIIGIGCKKGKEAQKIKSFVKEHLSKAGISFPQIYGIASIDLKKDEPGICELAKEIRRPFFTYPAEELAAVGGDFSSSSFVKEKVGVNNVCERAALCMSGNNGRLVYQKHAEDGMTIAIAKRDWSIRFDEE